MIVASSPQQGCSQMATKMPSFWCPAIRIILGIKGCDYSLVEPPHRPKLTRQKLTRALRRLQAANDAEPSSPLQNSSSTIAVVSNDSVRLFPAKLSAANAFRVQSSWVLPLDFAVHPNNIFPISATPLILILAVKKYTSTPVRLSTLRVLFSRHSTVLSGQSVSNRAALESAAISVRPA